MQPNATTWCAELKYRDSNPRKTMISFFFPQKNDLYLLRTLSDGLKYETCQLCNSPLITKIYHIILIDLFYINLCQLRLICKNYFVG